MQSSSRPSARSRSGSGVRFREVPPEDSPQRWPKPGDTVIAVMGVTGSGKSSLIRHLSPDRNVVVGHSVFSETVKVGMFLCRHPDLGELWLIDTPGFSDTHRTDAQILGVLADWLRAAYLEDIKLTGVIYLHSIMSKRLNASSLRALSLFRDLIGDDALNRVFLVTTFWDTIRSDQWVEAEERERQLHEENKYWGRFISRGAQTKRHNDARESAYRLIGAVIQNQNRPRNDEGVNLLLPQELAEGVRLENTSVGRNVKEAMSAQMVAWEKELADLRQELRQELQEMLQRQAREHDERLAEAEREHTVRREKMQRDQELLQASRATIDERLQRLEATNRAQEEAEIAREKAETKRLQKVLADEAARGRQLEIDRERSRQHRERLRRLQQREQDLWYPRCVHM